MEDDLSFVFKFIKYWSVQNLLTIYIWNDGYLATNMFTYTNSLNSLSL